MKKVFHVISHFDVGGAERVAVNIAKSKTEGFEYHVVEVMRGNSDFTKVFVAELDEIGIQYHRAHMPDFRYHFIAETLATSLFPLWFLPIYLKHRPDVIHAHTEIPEMAVCMFYRLFPWLVKDCRLVRTIHNTQLWKGLRRIGNIVERLMKERNANIAISQSVLDNFTARFGQTPPMIYNGVAPVSQKPYEEIVPGKINVLVAGRLEPQKGIATLVEVVKRLAGDDRYHFHILGDGSLRPLVEQELGNQANVSLRPPLHGLPAYLASFDYLFMPSEYEGLSIMSIEASITALPVIANDCPGLSDTLPKDWPLKVQNNDIDSYMHLFRNVIPTASKAELGNRAQAFATEYFSIEQMQKAYEKVYSER